MSIRMGMKWMRQKWNAYVQKYWKISEQMMVKNADLLICDSKNIEQYIKRNMRNIILKPRLLHMERK